MAAPDPADFIRDNLRVTEVPGIAAIRLYRAHAKSRLSRLTRDDAPYWAYMWGGGMVMARHILDHPDIVKGRRVLDLGSGSGLVAIAAALSGATVTAVDIDPLAVVATTLNAALNGVKVEAICADPTQGPVPDCDLILAGDVFYDAGLAVRMTSFLSGCVAAGIEVLVGDPGRAHLPHAHLEPIASYEVPDFGHVAGQTVLPSTVFRFT